MEVLWLTHNMRKAYLQYASLYASFISNTFKSQARLKLAKIQVNAKQHSEAECLKPKIIRILHPRYPLTITGPILKNKQKSKHVCIHEIMQLIIMKTKSKMKIDSHRYGINIPGCRHKHKYTKYIKRLSLMMLICIRQHLSNI